MAVVVNPELDELSLTDSSTAISVHHEKQPLRFALSPSDSQLHHGHLPLLLAQVSAPIPVRTSEDLRSLHHQIRDVGGDSYGEHKLSVTGVRSRVVIGVSRPL
uniref:Uncharacterized protein n=1 Tax=Arcella intermedia TaxID=1963864 RepID=A0A6B2LKF9_9EUKA